MTAHYTPQHHGHRWIIILVLVALHGALVNRWWNSHIEKHKTADATRATLVWVPLTPATPAPTPALPPAAAPAIKAPTTPAIRNPNAPVLPGVTTPEVTLSAGSVTASPEPPASSPKKLNLALPRWMTDSAATAPRNPTLAASMPKGARPDVAEALAKALGDGNWQEENLGDGRRRFRSGNSCIETRPTRAGQLNPFSNAPPTLVGAC